MTRSSVRLWIAAAVICFAVGGAQAQDSKTVALDYVIKRNGGQIGTIKHKITRDGDSVTFDSVTDITVEKLDITLYHQDNEFHSVWKNGELQSFTSATGVQGTKSHVEGKRQGDVIVVKASGDNTDAPKKSLPDTYWNMEIVEASHLIGIRDGAITEIDVSKVQPTEVTVGGKKIPAQHFLMTGGDHQSLYYDHDNNWIGLAYHRKNGDLIEIIRQ